MVLADEDAAVANDDAGDVGEVPLERDGGDLGEARDGVVAGGISDDPEVDDLEGQGYQEGAPEPGMSGSHTRRDGERGAEVG